MGNTESIKITETSNGIFEVNMEDNPDYPIVYLRLCWDLNIKKYCKL